MVNEAYITYMTLKQMVYEKEQSLEMDLIILESFCNDLMNQQIITAIDFYGFYNDMSEGRISMEDVINEIADNVRQRIVDTYAQGF